MQQLVKQNAIYRMKGPTVLNAEEINAISSEICALILWAGKTPTEGENTQMLEAVQAMIYTKSEVDVFITALSERADKLEAVVPDEASSSNKLADKKYVDASVSSNTAHYVSSSAAGDSFATVAALLAGPCYYGGQAWTPTPNDYAFVQADENHGGVQARYAFVGGQWVYQYTVDTPLPDGAITDDKIGPRTLADEAGALAVPPVGPATLTAHIQHIRNTLKGLVERPVESPLRFIGASGIDVNRDGNTITISETGTHRLPELLEHRFFDHILNTLSWLRADTFSWQDGTVYTAAYNELLTEYNNAAGADETDGSISFKRTPKGYKICAADQHDNVADLYNTTGVAWYYILDVPNQRFKLPRTKFGFTGLRTGAGNYVAPGLPDHTHQAPYGKNDNGQYHNQGSARPHPATAEWFTTINGYGKDSTPASASNGIYGASTTVQPPATEMYLYFFVGNFTQSAVEQTAGISAETLNNKADLDGMNAPALMKVPQFWQGTDFAKMRAAIMDLDWANAIRTWSSTADSYRTEVMPADGLLAGVLSYSGQIEINGNKYSIGTTDSNWAGSYVPFFVKKGDVVKARFNSSYAVLVPFKNQGNADYNPLGFFQYQGQFADSASLPTPKINGWALVGNNQLYYVGTDDTGALVWLAGNTITDLGVTGADYVVESYSDDSGNWWRKYKSGWIEQGGYTTNNANITFLKPFSNDKYTFTVSPVGSFGSQYSAHGTSNRTTTGISVAYGGDSSSPSNISWFACGQGA